MGTYNPAMNRDEITNMLKINSKLPAATTKEFSTVQDNQAGVVIDVYESRSTEDEIEIDGKTPLTSVEMKFVRPVPGGTGVIMTFSLDNSGILHIMAEEQQNHSKLDTTFQLSNQMTDEEMRSASVRMASATIE